MKKSTLLIAIMLLLSMKDMKAQNLFQKYSPDIGYATGTCVRLTSDSGFVICGVGNSTGADYTKVIRLNKNGDTLWVKHFAYGNPSAIMQLADNSFVISGTLSNSNAFVIRVTAYGDTIWSRHLNPIEINASTISENGNMIFVGEKSCHPYILEMDTSGNLLWTKKLDAGSCSLFQSIEKTNDHSLIGSLIAFDDTTFHMGLIKLDTLGTPIWCKLYGGMNSDYGYSAIQTSDGGFIITGAINGTTTNQNTGGIGVIKTDSNGDTLWTRSYEGYSYGRGAAIVEANSGGYVLCGTTELSSVWKMISLKLNNSGNQIWQNSYGGSSVSTGFSIAKSTDNGFVMTGSVDSAAAHGNYIVKIDANGNSCQQTIASIPLINYPINYYPFSTTYTTFTLTNQPYSFSLASALISSTICSSTGIAENANMPVIDIFPNPSEGEFTIELKQLKSDKTTLKISNILGEIIDETNLVDGQNKIHASLKSGLYFITLNSKTFSLTKKIIIE